LKTAAVHFGSQLILPILHWKSTFNLFNMIYRAYKT
jgi:hypothetical protein